VGIEAQSIQRSANYADIAIRAPGRSRRSSASSSGRGSVGRAYLDRPRHRRGMAVARGVLVRAFASVGWQWGGRWAASPDWQHFSRTGG